MVMCKVRSKEKKMEQNVALAFGLTVLAGLATVVGSGFAYFVRKSDGTFFSIAMGFSAGMMIYISFMEILPEASHSISSFSEAATGETIAIVAFFLGMLLVMGIDAAVPNYENPHHIVDDAERAGGCNHPQCPRREESLMRLGIFSAIAIAIHNFPEGMATFISALENPKVGLQIASAIAIHNIPEGIAVSIPIYAATKSKRKAFWYSFFSGISEPLGAIIGYLVLRPFISESLMGILLAGIAGVMVFISVDGLIPAAHKYGKAHVTVYGIILGMAVMAGSLLMF
jgi:ZIP family zinc transporter